MRARAGPGLLGLLGQCGARGPFWGPLDFGPAAQPRPRGRARGVAARGPRTGEAAGPGPISRLRSVFQIGHICGVREGQGRMHLIPRRWGRRVRRLPTRPRAAAGPADALRTKLAPIQENPDLYAAIRHRARLRSVHDAKFWPAARRNFGAAAAGSGGRAAKFCRGHLPTDPRGSQVLDSRRIPLGILWESYKNPIGNLWYSIGFCRKPYRNL